MSQPSIDVAERRRERPSDNVPRRPAAVGVICDLVEENWPSMDLVGQMLLDHLQQNHAGDLQAVRLCPPMVRRYSALPFSSRNRKAYNLDRLVSRFWMYPRWLRRRVDDFEIFHLVDHSYSQLIHELPAERTLVTCHDLEAFRGALTPGKGIASSLRRLMAQRILSGFRKAAHVTCDSQAIKDELLSYNLIPAERATVVANGFHPSCSPKPNAEGDLAIERLLGPRGEGPELLNVGTTVARKRIDILLQVFAEVRRQVPGAKLIRVGGEFTAAHSRLIDRLGISASIVILPFLTRPALAALYRRATLVLQSSSYEGFGLPIVEAMACGATVVATDIPVFREVGGPAVIYCPQGDVAAWTRAAVELLDKRRNDAETQHSRRSAALSRAAGFTWDAYAARMSDLYRKILNS